MRRLSRRAFVGVLAAAFPTALLVRQAHAVAIDDIVARPRTLRALAEAVLPSELPQDRIAATVTGFQRWIAGYREGAELVHGYGTSKLDRAGPTPATRWATQLDALDADAARSHAREFAALTVEQRRSIVQTALDTIKTDGIPPIGRAPHVALALLAHFYSSAEATDLCYQSAIARQNCRPLSLSTRRPLPLAGSRDA